MACKLTKSTSAGVDFEGKTGDQVQLGASSDSWHCHIRTMEVYLVLRQQVLTVLVDNPVPRDLDDDTGKGMPFRRHRSVKHRCRQ